MQKLLLTALLSLGAAGILSAQNTCQNAYAYVEEGSTLEYSSFDKNGKLSGVFQHHCKNIEEASDTLVAYLDVHGADAKGEEIYAGMYTMKCHNGTVYMDMRGLVPAQMTAQQEMSMEVEVDNSEVVMPADMEPGQVLEDAEMTLRMMSNGSQFMQMRYLMTNRKVEAREMVTVKAGTFECLKLSHDMDIKMVVGRKIRSVQWFARGVGMIKSESYDKNGKLESSMELTQFER